MHRLRIPCLLAALSLATACDVPPEDAVTQALEDSEPAETLASPAPNCVHVDAVDNGFYTRVEVINRCPGYQRVKIIWAFDLDSSCHGLHPGQGWREIRTPPSRFDGLVGC